MSLRADLVPLADLEANRSAAWADLVGRAVEPNPFFEPDYLVPTVEHRGVGVTLLAVYEGRDMVACLPLYGHGRTILRLPVWGMPNVLGVPHVDPEYAETAFSVAIDFLASPWSIRRMLRLHRVPVDGTVGPALLAAVAALRCPRLEPEPVTCPMIKRRPSLTYVLDTLLGRTRSKLGQKRRNFESLLGSPLRLVDRAAEPSAVERFLDLEAAGWKGRARTAMAFTAGEPAFFRAMCARFRTAGRLRMLSLEASGTVVAMRCDVTAGEGLFSLKTSYDERYARFSPGLLLEVDSVGMFHDSPAAWLSSATNYAGSPTFAVYPDRRTLVDAVAVFDGITRQILPRLVATRRRVASRPRAESNSQVDTPNARVVYSARDGETR
jgi:GNAT acetyltransferase-like protein